MRNPVVESESGGTRKPYVLNGPSFKKQPNDHERAKLIEKTREGKRVTRQEATAANERATLPETIRRNKRVTRREATEEIERATLLEKTMLQKRIFLDFYPGLSGRIKESTKEAHLFTLLVSRRLTFPSRRTFEEPK